MPPNPLYGLAAWRERRGLSLEELATRAGLTVATLKRLEDGNVPAYTTVWKIADALEVEPHWLYRANSERLEQGAVRSRQAAKDARLALMRRRRHAEQSALAAAMLKVKAWLDATPDSALLRPPHNLKAAELLVLRDTIATWARTWSI